MSESEQTADVERLRAMIGDKPKGFYGYVGFDHDRGEVIAVGDVVVCQDEWGYWRDDPERSSGRIESHHGWFTMIVRADGTRFLADGHTTRFALVTS